MVKVLRWILFLILSVCAVVLFDWLLEHAILLVSKLKWYWIVLIILFGGSLIYGLLASIFNIVAAGSLSISPRPNVGKWIVALLCFSALIFDCVKYAEYDFSTLGLVVLYVVVVSSWLTIGISFAALDTDN